MNRVITTFLDLRTEENLSDNWVKKVWTDTGFANFVPFPTEYDLFLEEVSICDVLNEYYDALNGWFVSCGISIQDAVTRYSESKNDSDEHEMTWQILVNEGMDYKSLICILGTLILRFVEEPTNSTYFKEALISVRLYLFCVAIPGSNIFQIFNATLFSQAMSVVRTCCEQIDGPESVKAKGTKRKANENDDGDDEDENDHRLQCDKTDLVPLMNNFLNYFKVILENRKFRLDSASVNLTLQILIMVTKLEKMNAKLLMCNIQTYKRDSVSYVAFKSFRVLLSMAKVLHSTPAQSAKLLVKELCPIFFLNESRTQGLGVKDGSVVRANHTYFLRVLMDELGEHAYEAINILVQRICVAVPDRAEMRLKATSVAIDVLKVSVPELRAEQIFSIVYMSHMPETKTRMFTLEIISKLLLESDGSLLLRELPNKYAAIVNDEFLLAVIFYRTQDIAVGIRTKALSYLDQFISNANSNARLKKLHDKIFVDQYLQCTDPETVPEYRKELFDTQQYILDAEDFDEEISPLPGVKVILDMLVYFSQEDKVFIKKCSTQTLAKILLSNRRWINKELLQVFLIGCDDSSVLLRKTVSQILTDLITMYPDHPSVITCWVDGVVPMIAEEEMKAQEKVVEHYCKVILNNLMLHQHTTSTVSRLPWLVIKEILKQKKRSYLHYATAKWIQGNFLKPKTVQVLYSHVDTDNNDEAWCLLASCSQFMNLPNAEFIFEYYERIWSSLDTVPHSQLILETVYYVCAKMSPEMKKRLLQQLEFNLLECRIPLKLISRSRDICEMIVSDLAEKNKSHAAIVNWSSPKITHCLEYIESQIGKDAPMEIENDGKLMKCVFLLGDLAQAAPKCITKSNIKLLQNILLAPKRRDINVWKGRVSTTMKAVTILTLAKLSLQKEETASSIMPVFREILSSESVEPSIQVNAIIGMCDLCSRYTTLVERYFTHICKCFNSKHECVRKTALVSVIKRIKEEYVKLRPFIVFPMLTMILDKSLDIKRIIATFIGVDLKKKNNILETFYTGLFFFLNNCKNHSTTVKIPDDIRAMFSYTDNPDIRNYVYIYILDKLSDTSKRLLVSKKIVNDIMVSLADEVIQLDEKTESILSDAFDVLIDNERKISDAICKSKKTNVDDGDEMEEAEGSSQSKKAPAVNITEGLRMNEVTEMMPVIFKLKQRLKKHKSRCMQNLILYMCELMKNYKDEMSDLLTNDMELKAEVDYKLRRFEVEQEERRRREEANDSQSRDEIAVPVIPEANTSMVEEINEQMHNLILELTRCDDQVGLPVPPLPQVRGNVERDAENGADEEAESDIEAEVQNDSSSGGEEEDDVELNDELVEFAVDVLSEDGNDKNDTDTSSGNEDSRRRNRSKTRRKPMRSVAKVVKSDGEEESRGGGRSSSDDSRRRKRSRGRSKPVRAQIEVDGGTTDDGD